MYIVYGPPSLGRYHTTELLAEAIGALQMLIQVVGQDGHIEYEGTDDVLYRGYAETGVIEYQDWLTEDERDDSLTERGL